MATPRDASVNCDRSTIPGTASACALSPARVHKFFCFDQRKTADSVDLFRNDDFTRLQVLNHAQQLGTVGSSARGLLAIDRSYVVA
ncbi:DNA-binding transcriptional regulator [Pseudomonas syringae pv. actinidiae]|uniref:DNA-binding transcriptional regulator n=1 Tax=Pseudomonas syringae pv. actinidiae TaxID=103796 RepID=A0AAN4Q390_PSESF|nr:DNA-binding transcriptional regulator [Pseudomonas syringae pv. actinidiae]